MLVAAVHRSYNDQRDRRAALVADQQGIASGADLAAGVRGGNQARRRRNMIDRMSSASRAGTSYFGAQPGDIAEGDVVVVFGAVPVGLFAAQSAWLMGAGRVIVVDHLDYRLEKAREFAHAETLNLADCGDVVVEMKRMTGYLGADVAIDAVGAEADGNLLMHVTAAKFKLQGGSPVALNWAIDSVRKGGTISVMGAYGPMFSAVKFGDAMNKGLTINTNQCPVKRQWPQLFSHIRNRYLKPKEIITMDPIIVAGPWVAAGVFALGGLRALARRGRRSFAMPISHRR